MKIGLSIICFDGTEHLDRVLSEAVQWADHIRVIDNQYSREGTPGTFRQKRQADTDRILAACAKYPVDHVVEINQRPATTYREIAGKEAGQRQAEYLYWAALGVDWCAVIDADEVYYAEDVNFFKNLLIEVNAAEVFDFFLSAIYTYYNQPNYRTRDTEPYYVPFLAQPGKVANMWPKLVKGQRGQLLVDPTRGLIGTHSMMPTDRIAMHHYSWVRDYPEGYRVKMLNSTAKFNPKSQKNIEEIPLLVPGHRLKNWPALIEV